ncbi:MAG: hypothetical protein IT541_15645 [Hyphomicrobiales bacterium]|nr:hypothetical protein [Hyphomicrobiales bacterium]
MNPEKVRRKARVKWLCPEEGGYSVPPNVERYAGIAKFAEDDQKWPDGAWTIVITFAEPPVQQGRFSNGVAEFLVEWAPQERLQTAHSFDLYEGLRHVACVELM